MTPEQAVNLVDAAIAAELRNLTSDIKGMTTPKVKSFLNRIGAGVSCYLEIGLYRGATFLAAVEDNPHLYAVGIDNWSQFGGPKGEFFTNLWTRQQGNPKIAVYNADAFSEPIRKQLAAVHAPFDAMFYDGDHHAKSQKQAVEMFSEIMAPVGILIVDDWVKWGRRPTLEAVEKMGLTLHRLWELPRREYWEGVGVLVLERG